MGLFAVVISIAVLLTNALAWGTWSYFTGRSGLLVWELISAGLGIAFVATAMIGFRHTSPLLRLCYRICAT